MPPTSKTPPAEPAQLSQQDAGRLSHLYQSGQIAEAERLASQLCQAYPQAAFPLNILGLTLEGRGLVDDAIACFKRALKLQPDFGAAHFNLGNALKDSGRPGEALASYRRAMKFLPDRAELHCNMAGALLDAGKLQDAVAGSQQALKINPNLAPAHYNLGSALMHLGRLQDAVVSFARALAIDPRFVAAHANLASTFKQLGDIEKAAYNFAAAVRLAPNDAKAHRNLGLVLIDLGRIGEAANCFRKAIGVKPDYPDAYLSLASILDGVNRLDELRQLVAAAGRHCAGDFRVPYMQALVLRREGNYAAARKVLEASGPGAADAQFRAARGYLLGELCDRLGDADAAFGYAGQANRDSGATEEARRIPVGPYLAQVGTLARRFTPEWVDRWRPPGDAQDRPAPAFLVGFPLSGDGLLAMVLRRHPGVAVVSGSLAVRRVQEALNQRFGGYPAGLQALTPANLAALREAYFTELDRHLPPERRNGVVIDGLPLNIVHAGLIHRIFPKARFLFVQRHPFDCVLDCFMQNFRLNDAMVNFLDLKGAAQTYDRVMQLWEQYRKVLALQVHVVRHEDLVGRLEETLRPILGYLGLSWTDDMRMPIEARAVDHWMAYGRNLEPVVPVLLPWAERLGYPAGEQAARPLPKPTKP